MKNIKKNEGGFTLIEILIVIGIIAILATVVLIALNPARQFAQARDSQRVSNLNAILNAVGQRIADNQGLFSGDFTAGGEDYTCPDFEEDVITPIHTTEGTDPEDFGCLIPTYIPALPFDPTSGSGTNTGYSYLYDPDTGRLTIMATALEPTITRDTALTVTR